jgi:hypothetical protein
MIHSNDCFASDLLFCSFFHFLEVCKRNGRLNSGQGETAERLINLAIHVTTFELQEVSAGSAML